MNDKDQVKLPLHMILNAGLLAQANGLILEIYKSDSVDRSKLIENKENGSYLLTELNSYGFISRSENNIKLTESGVVYLKSIKPPLKVIEMKLDCEDNSVQKNYSKKQ